MNDPFAYSSDELIRAAQADGMLRGKPVHIVGKPIEIAENESFTVKVPVPPLHRPEIEVVLETLLARDGETGPQRIYRAFVAQESVKVGCVKIVLERFEASATDKEEAGIKLGKLVGQAVVQVYMKLLTSDDPDEVAAARSMEIGS